MTTKTSYVNNQFQRLLEGTTERTGFTIRLSASDRELPTNFLNCSRHQVEQIAAIMTEGQLSSGPAPDYVIDSPASPQDEDSIIAHAIDILRKRCEHEFIGTSDSQVKNWLALSVGELDHEEFGMLMLDSQHRLIERQVISSGTISSAMVYPREVVKAALKCNAAAVVIYHNHPSGIVVESRADLAITNKLINSLKAIEVQVLDHIIVGGGNSMSFAAKGLI